MSDDDDIARQLLEGDAYDEAKITVRRIVGLSLDQKILVAVGTLLAAVPLGPATLAGTDHITALEPALVPGERPKPALASLVLFGAVSSFLGGLLLVWQRHRRHTRSFDLEAARRFVRVEDFFLMIVLQGTLFVVVPTGLAVAGALVPDVATTLYNLDVRVYRPHPTAGTDTAVVSAVSGTLAVVLTLVWHGTRRRS